MRSNGLGVSLDLRQHLQRGRSVPATEQQSLLVVGLLHRCQPSLDRVEPVAGDSSHLDERWSLLVNSPPGQGRLLTLGDEVATGTEFREDFRASVTVRSVAREKQTLRFRLNVDGGRYPLGMTLIDCAGARRNSALAEMDPARQATLDQYFTLHQATLITTGLPPKHQAETIRMSDPLCSRRRSPIRLEQSGLRLARLT